MKKIYLCLLTATFFLKGLGQPTCVTPSQKPTMIRYGGSAAGTSMTIYFTRGNGSGSLVLCKQGSAVDAAPVNGVTYSANSNFMSGSQIGTGNYAVFNTTYKDVNAFTVSGLTAGVKYYFSIFEYNDPDKCYTTTGLIDSFTVGGNLLSPGDIAFTGWDNDAISGGDDKLYMVTMVDIAKGTRFSLVNSRFEAGAPANTRTNHWFSGGSDPFQDPYTFELEYNGSSPIAQGSIISVESNGLSGFTNIAINGSAVPASTFTVTGNGNTSNFLSATAADQVYIIQGKFTSYGTAGVDRYNLLTGTVIHGFTADLPWVPLTNAVSAATDGTGGESRIPPQIICTAVEFNVPGNTYGVYQHSAGSTGTKSQLLTAIRNNSNWKFTGGTPGVDDVPLIELNVNDPFIVNAPTVGEGQWVGNSTDWFDCSNWGGLHVPDSTTSTLISTVATPFFPIIDVTTSTYATQYENIAHTGDLLIDIGSSLYLTSPGKEKLVVDGSLTINNGASLNFESSIDALNDTLFVHRNITDNSSSITPSFIAGMGNVILAEARFSSTNALTKLSSNIIYNNLSINNTRSTDIKAGISVSNNLNLQNGYLNIITDTGSINLGLAASISSPVNVYGYLNKGYHNSFVNGKMFYETGAALSTHVFPIGKVTGKDTAYAPVELVKANALVTIYDAEYFPVAYSNLTANTPVIHHVSRLEHWAINSLIPAADAKVSLSWRPRSEVGDGVTTPSASLDKLVVAHFLDDDGAGSNTPLWHIEGSDVAIMPKNGSATTSYGTVTTNLFNSIADITNLYSSAYFTLGTRDASNILPVKLLDLAAIAQQQNVLVKWRVSNEQQVNRYEVEKSTDGLHFSTMTSVIAVNSIPVYDYQVIDQHAAAGWNYYRLSVYDNAGKSNYTSIVKVWIGKMSDFIVYPNPATDAIKINLPVSSSISQIAIVNSSGQVVKQLTTTEQSLTINIESLSKGMYFIRILNSRQAIVQKFTKQ